jgi:hypothetical protein
MSKPIVIEGYCMKLKSKQAFVDPIISKNAKGGFVCKGETKDGHKMCAIMSKEKAEAAIASGVKKEGF